MSFNKVSCTVMYNSNQFSMKFLGKCYRNHFDFAFIILSSLSFRFSTASPTCSSSVSGSPAALRIRPYASKIRPTRMLIIRMPGRGHKLPHARKYHSNTFLSCSICCFYAGFLCPTTCLSVSFFNLAHSGTIECNISVYINRIRLIISYNHIMHHGHQQPSNIQYYSVFKLLDITVRITRFIQDMPRYSSNSGRRRTKNKPKPDESESH